MSSNDKTLKTITHWSIAFGIIANILGLICEVMDICELLVYVTAALLSTGIVFSIATFLKTRNNLKEFGRKFHLKQVINLSLWLTILFALFFHIDEKTSWYVKILIAVCTVFVVCSYFIWAEADVDLDNEKTYIEHTVPWMEISYTLSLYTVLWMIKETQNKDMLGDIIEVLIVALSISIAISTNLWPKLFPRPNNNQVTPNTTPETTESKEVLPTTVPPTNEPPKPQPIPEPIPKPTPESTPQPTPESTPQPIPESTPEPAYDSTNLIQKELHALKTIVVIFIVLSFITMALLVGTVIGAPTLVRAWSDQMEAVPVNSTVVVEQETSKYNPNSGAMYTADNT